MTPARECLRFSTRQTRFARSVTHLLRPVLRALPGVLAALFLAAAPAARAEAPTVKDIKVEGLRRVDPVAIRRVLAQKKGEPLDRKKVDADIRAIMRLGFFQDVEVLAEGDTARPNLVYRVREKPTVHEATITGNVDLSKDDLKDTVDVKAYSVYDPAAVKKDVKKIQDKYVEKGFFLAEVTSEVKQLPDNQVDVVYLVNEKAKVQVRQLNFVGNRQVRKEELTPYLQTQEGSLLSLISNSGTFKEDAFEKDQQAVQALYLDKGFVNIKVGKPTIALTPDKTGLFITIPVEEGEKYNIGKIEFAGETLGEEAALRRIIRTKSGELFSRSKVGGDLFAVGDHFKDMGYAYANVTPLTNTDPKTRIVDLSYEIQPGPLVYFERIEITGNDKTRDKVVRRELRIYEGQKYNATGIKVSKNRVTALGFFETVEIKTRPGSASDKIIAEVTVKERATGTFQIGAGFSSYENFILTGQISQNNFFGWGQTLSLQVQWSSVRQLGQIQFVEPYFLDTRWTFAFDVYATEGAYTTFTRRAIGGSMTWGYELNGLEDRWSFAKHLEDVRLFATYTNERVTVSNATSNVVIQNQFKSGTTSSLRLSLQADKRDNRLFPTAGWFTSASAEIAPPALAPASLFGQEVNLFSRYTADARYYQPLLWGVVARAKLTLGYIRNWDGAHPVPISELYYVGGINSVRGYRYLSIAPTQRVNQQLDPRSRTSDLVVGGDKQVVVNAEVEFPMFEKAGVRGVLFFDAGNAFARGEFKDPELKGWLRKSVGFGFRWVSPIGPLRFEWGIPLDRRRNRDGTGFQDQPLDFQFTIGNFF